MWLCVYIFFVSNCVLLSFVYFFFPTLWVLLRFSLCCSAVLCFVLLFAFCLLTWIGCTLPSCTNYFLHIHSFLIVLFALICLASSHSSQLYLDNFSLLCLQVFSSPYLRNSSPDSGSFAQGFCAISSPSIHKCHCTHTSYFHSICQLDPEFTIK